MTSVTLRANLLAMSRFVYFVQAENGLIKIGLSSKPQARFDDLQANSPLRLTLLNVIKGTFRTERALHTKFKAARQHNEWFSPHPELLAFIEAPSSTISAIPDAAPAPFHELTRPLEETERNIARRAWTNCLLDIGSPERRFVAEIMSGRRITDSQLALLNLIAGAIIPAQPLPFNVRSLIARYYENSALLARQSSA